MKVKFLWLIAMILNIVIGYFSDFNVVQAFYSFVFGMIAIICFYLSWICELLSKGLNNDQ